ncbi:MAG: hypothetical protein JWO67_51 [Streptosporangiaceae bacterium]|nr:hypothetical protein [Streptosporangiaceae bacterium]
MLGGASAVLPLLPPWGNGSTNESTGGGERLRPHSQLADWTFFAMFLAIPTPAAPLSAWLEL